MSLHNTAHMLLWPTAAAKRPLTALCAPILPLQQALAVKQPVSSAADELLLDAQWLQKFQQLSSVPRFHGICKDEQGRHCVITSPVGKSLTWAVWDESSCSSRPLHQCLEALLDTIAQVHAADVVIRDLRPNNMVLADDRLIIVDWGSASSISSQEEYCGTTHYASDGVLQALAASSAAKVLPADDLVCRWCVSCSPCAILHVQRSCAWCTASSRSSSSGRAPCMATARGRRRRLQPQLHSMSS